MRKTPCEAFGSDQGDVSSEGSNGYDSLQSPWVTERKTGPYARENAGVEQIAPVRLIAAETRATATDANQQQSKP